MKNKIKKEKEFDAVKMMREIRNKLSQKISSMTFEEEKEYFKKLLRDKRKLQLN